MSEAQQEPMFESILPSIHKVNDNIPENGQAINALEATLRHSYKYPVAAKNGKRGISLPFYGPCAPKTTNIVANPMLSVYEDAEIWAFNHFSCTKYVWNILKPCNDA